MATLTPETVKTYSRIIDEILAASDINTISAKRIRKGLEERGHAIAPEQKQQVTDLILHRFDRYRERIDDPSSTSHSPTTDANTNGHSNPPHSAAAPAHSSPNGKKRSPSASNEDGESSNDNDNDSPPPKKKKKAMSAEEEDEAYAKRLQAEFDAKSRSRSTRGANSATAKKKRAVAPKRGKKKSAARINDEDDSDLGSGSEAREKKEPKRTGGFHKPLALSAPLASLLNETHLSRPQTVKKIWEYVKARDLQDPADKRQIRCDDAMRAVFKSDRVHMFTMNKILNQNLYAVDE